MKPENKVNVPERACMSMGEGGEDGKRRIIGGDKTL
jgi:hypothetical protein